MEEDMKELVDELRTNQPDTSMCNAAADMIEELYEATQVLETALMNTLKELRGYHDALAHAAGRDRDDDD